MPSKLYNIRRTESDTKAVKNMVARFNRKLARAEREAEDASFLPERASAREIWKRVKTRSDLNFELNRLKRFLKPGAEGKVTTEGGATVTKFAIQDMRALQRRANVIQRRLSQEAIDLAGENGKYSQEIAYKRREMQGTHIEPGMLTQKGFKRIYKALPDRATFKYKDIAEERYFRDYKDVFKRELGSAKSTKQYKEVWRLLKSMSPQQFLAAYYKDATKALSIGFLYGTESVVTKLNSIESALRGFLNDNPTEEK